MFLLTQTTRLDMVEIANGLSTISESAVAVLSACISRVSTRVSKQTNLDINSVHRSTLLVLLGCSPVAEMFGVIGAQ